MSVRPRTVVRDGQSSDVNCTDFVHYVDKCVRVITKLATVEVRVELSGVTLFLFRSEQGEIYVS